MNRSTIRFLALITTLYFAVLLIVRGFLPESFDVPLYFLEAPLLLVVAALLADLTSRVTVPTRMSLRHRPRRKLGRGIEQLTRQVEVATTSSRGYYETVLLARVRDLLIEKVSLETAMGKERVRETLQNKFLGPVLLHDQELYTLLYSGAPAAASGRLGELEKAAKLIEAWEP